MKLWFLVWFPRSRLGIHRNNHQGAYKLGNFYLFWAVNRYISCQDAGPFFYLLKIRVRREDSKHCASNRTWYYEILCIFYLIATHAIHLFRPSKDGQGKPKMAAASAPIRSIGIGTWSNIINAPHVAYLRGSWVRPLWLWWRRHTGGPLVQFWL